MNSNPFLEIDNRDTTTALLYEKAKVMDIKKAVAYTDGKQMYINTEENLNKILPDYNTKMLKWLLWHEKMHIELKHHPRYMKMVNDAENELGLTKEEVNIIMDILVHDWEKEKFSDCVETAEKNYAQMRDRNSLMFTFETNTLEGMLKEYSEFKKSQEGGSSSSEESKEDKSEESEENKSETKDSKPEEDNKSETKDNKPNNNKGSKSEKTSAKEEPASKPSRHHEVNWKKLEDIDTNEFIDDYQAEQLDKIAKRIEIKRIQLGRLTQKLNGLASTKRERSYRLPSHIPTQKGVMLKGKTPGHVDLCLVFDASGSMSEEISTFKKVIKNSIPSAMECPCLWFSGFTNKGSCYLNQFRHEKQYHGELYNDYFEGLFKDFLPIWANNGYDDDGDRTIELCWQAEQKGLTPIGVTDGGGCLNYPNTLRKLQRTVLVGHRPEWLRKVKQINPRIQTIELNFN